MIEAIKQARKLHRRAAECLYEDSCTVYELQPVKDEETKITGNVPVAVHEDVPCKLSFESMDAAIPGEAAVKTVSVKLFIAPEIAINPGSRIDVEHGGERISYKRSGVPAIYSTHQEIMLELFERWA